MLSSFKYAIHGLVYAIRHERNMKIHFVLMILATCLGFFFQISLMEWMIQLLLFAMVIGSELINTSIEKLTDGVYSGSNSNAKIIKDVAAGAVLFVSIIALVIGVLIYIPKLMTL